MNLTPQTLTARWIVPVSRPPIERGTLTILGDRIIALGSTASGRVDLDLGEAVVLPGLVNAHTHLDLTGLAGVAPFTGDFTGWLRTVIRHRLSRTAAQIGVDVRAGLEESIRFGVTLLGDISGLGLSADVLRQAPVRSVVFHEFLGLPQDRALTQAARAQSWLDASVTLSGSPCRPGLSPHAPYSVRADLFSALRDLASRSRVPLAVHLAETSEELELLAHHNGPFVPFLQEVGVWDPAGLVSSLEDVIARCGPALYVHGNYLGPDTDLPAGSSVVYCPRTHSFFQHPPHPFRRLLSRGVRVALGTDSRASNPDLDLLAEARFLHRRHPDLDPELLLRPATLNGAEALGWADEVGSLEPGKSADLVVIPVQAGANPWRAVLESDAPPSRVLCRGEWIVPCSALENQ
jgi:cytosine/adenosine deaminase-related metal-dependent hydrolase